MSCLRTLVDIVGLGIKFSVQCVLTAGKCILALAFIGLLAIIF